MAARKRIHPNQSIGLALTTKERLILQRMPEVGCEITDRIAAAPRDGAEIPFTPDQLDTLIGHVAASLNRTSETRKQRALEQIYDKINQLLRTHTNQVEGLAAAAPDTPQPPPVRMDEWANSMISTAQQAGIPTDRHPCKIVLSKAQRRTLLDLEHLNVELRGRLDIDARGSRTFHFTANELATICHILAEPLTRAQGTHRNQLLKAAEKIADGLNRGLADGRKPRRKSPATTTAFQLRIRLNKVKPAVWRRFQVRDCTLAQLHEVIQVVMGWEDSHLYSFDVDGVTYGDPTLCEDTDFADAGRIQLSRLVRQGSNRFEYLYDFGDDWQHVIEIESNFQPETQAEFPVCVEGSGTCPPEDVGGVMGYAEFLEAIGDPDHEEHEQYLDWCGGWFDPDAFDLDLVNLMLSRHV